MNEKAEELGIPVTVEFQDYGTRELAESALEIISMENPVIILKDHGFVAIGNTIEAAGGVILRKYRELLRLLEDGRS
mgnify:FL=1